MKTRWAKQLVNTHVDAVQESWFERTGELPVDPDADCAMVEGESLSITAEA